MNYISNYKDSTLILFRFDSLTTYNAHIHLHTMPHVGHWLHVEDLDGMLNIIMKESGLQ